VTSIFAAAMGSDFSRLHPELQRRFGVSSASGTSCVGRGVMDEIWRGAPFTVPFLWLGAWRNILVPTRGRAVPFTIENYAYVDSLGRETVTFNRTFELPGHRRARFDATMVRGAGGGIIDYLGTHQHLAVDLDMAAEPDGSLTIRSGAQRFYEGPIAFRFPEVLTGQAVLHERFDDVSGRFAIDVRVTNRRFGDLCGYRGTFTCDYPATPSTGVPASAKPRRDEFQE
jgi:hypothetical protein